MFETILCFNKDVETQKKIYFSKKKTRKRYIYNNFLSFLKRDSFWRIKLIHSKLVHLVDESNQIDLLKVSQLLNSIRIRATYLNRQKSVVCLQKKKTKHVYN